MIEVLVVDRKKIKPTHIQDAHLIVLSPGPGKPDDYPETKTIYREILGYQTNTWNLPRISTHSAGGRRPNDSAGPSFTRSGNRD